MGGTRGIIYKRHCKAAYAELKANAESEVTPKHWSGALKSSIASVSKYGGATAGYRTMLDVIIPASQVLEEAGRSSYVSAESLATVLEPGAMAAARAVMEQYMGSL
ncbi:hypothetical protein N665_0229s0070 [Sinapis alba]|nr:hypothetical protein N665_0229s0068 [Sinapis alba]KAF8100244.1 hypothetical protein N665_0229s0070 [Sinapis alba]